MRRRLVAVLAILLVVQLVFHPVSVSLVVGNSMEPTIGDGDIVVYSQYVSPSEGDIVRFSSEVDRYPYPVIHRAIDIGPQTVQTKGDNNEYRDSPIPREDVDGTVIYVLNVPDSLQFYRQFFPSDYGELAEAHRCGVTCQVRGLVASTR